MDQTQADALLAGVNFDIVIGALAAVGAILAGLLVSRKGIRFVLGMIK